MDLLVLLVLDVLKEDLLVPLVLDVAPLSNHCHMLRLQLSLRYGLAS